MEDLRKQLSDEKKFERLMQEIASDDQEVASCGGGGGGGGGGDCGSCQVG